MAAIVGAKGVFHPRGQTGCLVIKEQATIPHSWFSIGIFALLDIQLRVLHHRHVSPIVPGRHTNLSGQLVDAIDRTALVATRNHELLADGLDDIFLSLALQILQQALLHPLVDLWIRANGSNHDTSIVPTTLRFHTRHLFEIAQEVSGGYLHTTMFSVGIADGDIPQLQGTLGGLEGYKRVGRMTT